MLPVDPARFALFLGMMAAFAATPGPANLFAIATGVRGGPRAALLGAVGMNVANIVWLCAAGLGLGALITAFPEQFRWLGFAGAAYIAWLGVKSLRASWADQPLALQAAGGSGESTALRDGFLVQIANPKAVVFYTAVLPPFIDPARETWPQVLLFGAAILVCDMIAMSSYGLAGTALARALESPSSWRLFAGIVGLLLLSAAALIVLRH